jgi:uncharacterized protein YigE (DUF2233 family)
MMRRAMLDQVRDTRLGWMTLLLATVGLLSGCEPQVSATIKTTASAETRFLSYSVEPHRLVFYWQDEQGKPLRSLACLREWLAGKQQRLVFATNGGMYRRGNVPVGLYIENGRLRTPLDTGRGPGNFYLQPNGVFSLTTDGRAVIQPTTAFRFGPQIRYATQSGPMLVVDGRIHPAFRPSSRNLNVRNGMGLLPDGRVLLCMSKQPVNLYDFARYFQRRGCRNALYLDGFVSRTYWPAGGSLQTDGDFGVMVGVTEAAE